MALLATAAPATAADDCASEVIADWYDNGRVDELYPLHCYRDAIKALPVDVRDYSSARDDILRALAFAQQGKTDPGDGGEASSSGGGGSGSTPGSGSGSSSSGGGGSGSKGSGSGTTGDRSPATGSSASSGSEAATPVDTSGPSSLPMPLIVLAGLSALLLAAGSAGFLSRRLQGRR